MEIYEHDPALQNAFHLAGRSSVTDAEIDAIATHTCTACVIGEGGSTEAAQSILGAASGLLRAGGLAVKMESTGKAHSKQDWYVLDADQSLRALYDAFVTLIGGDGGGYSCGMHNLGLPDAAQDAALSDEDGARLLQTFLLYTLLEKPDLRRSQTCGAVIASASILSHLITD